MISKALRKWAAETGLQIKYTAPGSPWENGYCGRFNGELRDECLRQEIFYSLNEAPAVIGLWQNTYNRVRPHSSLGHRPPAPAAHAGSGLPATHGRNLAVAFHSARSKIPVRSVSRPAATARRHELSFLYVRLRVEAGSRCAQPDL